jgi:hypothetical protein
VYAVNYTPGSKNFRLKLDVPSKELISVRQIYPELGATRRVAAGATIEVEIKGERLAIFEVNNGVQGLPPQNPSAFPVDVALRRKSELEYEASFALPLVQEQLARRKDATGRPLRCATDSARNPSARSPWNRTVGSGKA